jgi:branched-chain amino acid transport system substrate-binding protein
MVSPPQCPSKCLSLHLHREALAATLACAVIFVVSCGGPRSNEITIGAIVPLTGDNAVYGTALKKGMDLALDEINGGGGIGKKKLRIVYEDDQANPQKGVTALTKLATVDKVPMVIGAMFSAVTLAIVPIADRQRIVLLSPTSSAVELTHASEFFFRIYPSDAYDGKFLADFAVSKLGAKTASILSIQVASVAEIVKVFKARYQEEGGKVVDEETYQQGETDFRTQLIKIKQSDPDVIFLPGYLREMAIQLTQAGEMRVKKPFLSISTLYDPKIFDLAGSAADGVMFSTPFFDPESRNPIVQHFVGAFAQKCHEKPNIWAAYGYDAVKISALAMQRGEAKASTIREELHKIKDFPGVTGVTTFDRNGDVIKDLTVLKVVDRRFIPY